MKKLPADRFTVMSPSMCGCSKINRRCTGLNNKPIRMIYIHYCPVHKPENLLAEIERLKAKYEKEYNEDIPNMDYMGL